MKVGRKEICEMAVQRECDLVCLWVEEKVVMMAYGNLVEHWEMMHTVEK